MSGVPCLAAVETLAAAGIPVLLMDTCSLLDIVRSPVRDELRVTDLEAAKELLMRAETSPAALSLVLDDQVTIEWAAHAERIERETAAGLEMAGNRLRAMIERMQTLSSASIPAAMDVTGLGFPRVSRAVADRFLAASLRVEDADQEKLKATDRMNKRIPPAHLGRSHADCIVTETCLRLSRELRAGGFSGPVVFLSSNTGDYCEGAGRKLHSALMEEFDAAGLQYAARWIQARYMLFSS